MRIDLYVHNDDVNAKLDRILEVQHRQGVLMSAALDALKAEIGEIAADVDKAVELLSGLSDGATAAEIADVTATLNSAQEKLDAAVQPKP